MHGSGGSPENTERPPSTPYALVCQQKSITMVVNRSERNVQAPIGPQKRAMAGVRRMDIAGRVFVTCSVASFEPRTYMVPADCAYRPNVL
jgi:hypothetical protein